MATKKDKLTSAAKTRAVKPKNTEGLDVEEFVTGQMVLHPDGSITEEKEPEASQADFIIPPETRAEAVEAAKDDKKKYVYLDVTDYKDYIKIMCEYEGVTMTKYLQKLIEQDRIRNARKVEEIKQKRIADFMAAMNKI